VLKVNKNTIGIEPILRHLIICLLSWVLVVKPNTWLTPIPKSVLVLVLVCDSKSMLRTYKYKGEKAMRAMYKVNMSLTKERLVTPESFKGDVIKDDILGPLIQFILCPIGIHVGVGSQRPSPCGLASPGGTPDYQSLRA